MVGQPVSGNNFLKISAPEQNGCQFAHNIFKCILLVAKICILTQISLKFVPKDTTDKKVSTG